MWLGTTSGPGFICAKDLPSWQLYFRARRRHHGLADDTLKANADAVRRIADELLAWRWIGEDTIARIKGNELIALLDG
jgi:hypothetical protein